MFYRRGSLGLGTTHNCWWVGDPGRQSDFKGHIYTQHLVAFFKYVLVFYSFHQSIGRSFLGFGIFNWRLWPLWRGRVGGASSRLYHHHNHPKQDHMRMAFLVSGVPPKSLGILISTIMFSSYGSYKQSCSLLVAWSHHFPLCFYLPHFSDKRTPGPLLLSLRISGSHEAWPSLAEG